MNNVVKNLVGMGYDPKEAHKIWLDVQESLKAIVLTEEGSVVIRNVGTLTVKHLPAETKQVFGEIKEWDERIKVSFRQGQYLNKEYRSKYTSKAKARAEIHKLLGRK